MGLALPMVVKLAQLALHSVELDELSLTLEIVFSKETLQLPWMETLLHRHQQKLLVWKWNLILTLDPSWWLLRKSWMQSSNSTHWIFFNAIKRLVILVIGNFLSSRWCLLLQKDPFKTMICGLPKMMVNANDDCYLSKLFSLQKCLGFLFLHFW